jgi:hypothetical protein
MSRYILIRRLRGPAFLLLIGVIALLNQADILRWGRAWPLFLILAGVLMLAERAALASEGGYPPPGYGCGGYPDAADPRTATGVPPSPGQPTAIVPASHDFGNDSEGEQR